MNSLHEEQIRRDMEEEYACILEYWMLTEKDERVKDFWSSGNSKYIIKLAQDDGEKMIKI